MRYQEFKLLTESRGLTARTPGEVYVNRQNPDHTLILKSVTVLPSKEESHAASPLTLSDGYINTLKLKYGEKKSLTAVEIKKLRTDLSKLTSKMLDIVSNANIPNVSDLAKQLSSNVSTTLSYSSNEQLMQVIEKIVGSNYHEDNKPTKASTAAIIAQFEDDQGNEHNWVRFLNKIPPQGVHGTWASQSTSLFLKQYQYSKSAKQESVPIKPADLIKDEKARDAQTLASEIKQNLQKTLGGTEHEQLINTISAAIDQALAGTTEPIPSPGSYDNVIAKYGGEYLGPIAVLGGGVTKGDINKMMEVLNIDTLVGGRVVFPQNKSEELIDSIFILPNGTQLEVSTKMHQGSGAASSLSGVAKQLNEEIIQQYPRGSEVVRLLGTKSAMDGPLLVAKMYNIIDQEDINALAAVSKASRNIDDIKSKRLRELTTAQGIAKGSQTDPSYRVRWHAITAVVNAMMPIVNNDQEFKDVCLAALNNNNYLQLITDLRKSGDSITIDYYGKFPAVYKGSPKLENKTYFSTGQKGRIGFKLK
jgi:hypothetical protein